MPEQDSSIKPSVRMTTVILRDGSPLSVLSSSDADDYLNELKRVFPQSDFETETVPFGRVPGHDKSIWCGTGAWDFLTKRVMNFRNLWAFRGTLDTKLPEFKLGDTPQRFLWLTTEHGQLVDFTKFVKPLAKYDVEISGMNQVRIVTVR